MFKEKGSKKRIVHQESKDTTTLDAKHNEFVHSLRKKHDELQVFEHEITSLRLRIDAKKIMISKMEEDTLAYQRAWDELLIMQDRVRETANFIVKLQTYEEELDYYGNTAPILFQYYNLLEKQEDHATAPLPPHLLKNHSKKCAPLPLRSILDAFKGGSGPVLDNLDGVGEDGVDPEPIIDKGHLVDQYLSYIDPDHVRALPDEKYLGECIDCKIPMMCLHQDGIMVCSKCGYQEILLVEQNKPLYRQSVKETSHFSYKRINHFNEMIAQIQGKESTDIPDEIVAKILNEIKKEKLDATKITHAKMRELLKKIKVNKYYEHIPYILTRICGQKAPYFPPELEEKLRSMFREIQAPFLMFCPAQRKNFLSYNYVLYKLFQILNKTEYLSSFSLLKSKEKLIAMEKIWEKIVNYLNWPFYPAV